MSWESGAELNERLARKINAYWIKHGADVGARCERVTVHVPETRTKDKWGHIIRHPAAEIEGYAIRSRLINGLPDGKEVAGMAKKPVKKPKGGGSGC